MKFDYVIGNPPYNASVLGQNDTFAPPVYNEFMDAAYTVSDKVELIHPARFLFNAGSTPKAWNKKMLEDKHFKILFHEADVSKVFANTNINGGIVISYRDANKDFGAIDVFTAFEELNEILRKVRMYRDFETMQKIVVTRTAYRLTKEMHAEHPKAITKLSDGHAYDMASNIFERLPEIFFAVKPEDNNEYIRIMGRENNERTTKYIKRCYVNNVVNFNKYKVVMSGADGAAGTIGKPIPARVTGVPTVIEPGIGTTESFISIGAFETRQEAEYALKYVKTKFARTLLGVLKVTQAITPDKWKYVPLQDFTPNSDINWSASIHDIDQQLYKKYGLSRQEINFIESHVKEMA